MRWMREWTIGAGVFLKGVNLMTHPNIRVFVILPFLLNIFFFGAMMLGLLWGWDALIEEGMAFFPLESSIAEFSLLLPLIWLLKLVLWVAFLFLIFSVSGVVFSAFANFFTAPLNGFLSEKVTEVLTHCDIPVLSWRQLIWRTLVRELQKILYWFPRLLVVFWISFILGFLPGVNLIGIFLSFCFSAWILALQYLDYVFDNHQLSFKSSLSMMRAHRFYCLGFGMSALALSVIPLVHFVAMPVSVCAGTYLGLWMLGKLPKQSMLQQQPIEPRYKQ